MLTYSSPPPRKRTSSCQLIRYVVLLLLFVFMVYVIYVTYVIILLNLGSRSL